MVGFTGTHIQEFDNLRCMNLIVNITYQFDKSLMARMHRQLQVQHSLDQVLFLPFLSEKALYDPEENPRSNRKLSIKVVVTRLSKLQRILISTKSLYFTVVNTLIMSLSLYNLCRNEDSHQY